MHAHEAHLKKCQQLIPLKSISTKSQGKNQYFRAPFEALCVDLSVPFQCCNSILETSKMTENSFVVFALSLMKPNFENKARKKAWKCCRGVGRFWSLFKKTTSQIRHVIIIRKRLFSAVIPAKRKFWLQKKIGTLYKALLHTCVQKSISIVAV